VSSARLPIVPMEVIATSGAPPSADDIAEVRIELDVTEHIDILEFLWATPAGIQPVLYLERHYLD
jgi:hypothetical protein